MRLLLLSLLPAWLLAQTLSTTLLSVNEEQGTAKLEQAQAGLSGVIVRHFNEEHSAIIANAQVSSYNAENKIANLMISPYDGLQQNSLPKGTWSPKAGDEVLIAPDYTRALLIAPDATVYDRITSAFKTLAWVHPDRFTAHLSISGHPSPTQEDFSGFCTDNAVGLLYIYLEHSLFTLDCKSLSLLQVSHAPIVYDNVKLPFFNRVESIREAFWGEGSDLMDAYAPYYLELMEEYNENSKMLVDYHTSESKNAYQPSAATEE
ncbi:MAG: plasminogen-binding N-terminal domain-containing protein [Sulfurimonadaceae bacterium]|nr:plasminogen-binding N-terminal domain-containing protein [Sulfurimonadaceae bacterium]